MSSVYGNYYNKLLKQFAEERGNYKGDYNDFLPWLEKRGLMGKDLIRYLNENNVSYVNSKSAELNTGPLDSNVIDNRHTTIISEYGSLFERTSSYETVKSRLKSINNKIIRGDFACIDGEPVILIGKRSINLHDYIDTYLSCNNIRDAFKLTKIYLAHPDTTMLISFYGETSDLDKKKKDAARDLICNKVPEAHYTDCEYNLNEDNQTARCYRHLILLPKKHHL